jgi:hypothetical protein
MEILFEQHKLKVSIAVLQALMVENHVVVLQVLLDHGEMPVAKIALKTAFTENMVGEYLHRLYSVGLVQFRHIGMLRKYSAVEPRIFGAAPAGRHIPDAERHLAFLSSPAERHIADAERHLQCRSEHCRICNSACSLYEKCK